MANKGNGLAPNIYKKLLKDTFIQNRKEGIDIKNEYSKNLDPILQKGDKYKPPNIKVNDLKEGYLKKMQNKPLKKQKKKIDIPNSITTHISIVESIKQTRGKKINPKQRKNQDSTNIYELPKHTRKFDYYNTFQNFYTENNKTDKIETKYGKTVSYNF